MGDDESGLLQALQDETELLDRDTSIETTLLIHPFVLQDFDKYNQFLNLVDDLIVDLRREGVLSGGKLPSAVSIRGDGSGRSRKLYQSISISDVALAP